MQSEMNAESALNVFSKIGSFGSTSRGSLGNLLSEYKEKKGEKGRNTVGKDVKAWAGEGKNKNCPLCVFTDDKLITHY